MFETVIIAVAALGIAAVFIFALAFVTLGASREFNAEAPARFSSPSMASAWGSARLAAGAPVQRGYVDALVRGLLSARAAIKGTTRSAIS